MNRNCLSYWFPKLKTAGVPVPRTEIVRTELNLAPMTNGEPVEGWSEFVATVAEAAGRIDPFGPWFLRSGQGSGKHRWKNTCFVMDIGRLASHVYEIVEWSEMVDVIGLPTDVWAVREMLPVTPAAVLPRYGDMPLVREVRAFVEDGRIVCDHPYWPIGSIADGFGMPKLSPKGGLRGPSPHADAATLARAIHGATPTESDRPHWLPVAQAVAAAFAGDSAWSVDLLSTRNGWYVTDMAEAGRSYHWPDCPNARKAWLSPPPATSSASSSEPTS